jgi:hypothetical protein
MLCQQVVKLIIKIGIYFDFFKSPGGQTRQTLIQAVYHGHFFQLLFLLCANKFTLWKMDFTVKEGAQREY